MQQGLCSLGWSYEEPAEVFTVDTAHQAMRQHRSCRVGECPRKTEAFRILVAAGRIVPDERVEKYVRQ
ncbi:hypothetical protein NDR87_13810 [Nocardia sp. CDC159]|uniref:Uncharacterized protein n=1 Tax=Nocardia pulmonis TaxID=2951408 RepID=A0A9X2IW25_9NOCA|nr:MULTISPECIES: hypothetical protein [Nocardia]MCM6774502.1 hypothetical protein [Nocardia pulmonis]MCM6787432.1 hypothetical protein [Nocardia sp. CDC159]